MSAATSERRKPQPRSTAKIARSRSPRNVAMSGAPRRACACRFLWNPRYAKIRRIEDEPTSRLPLELRDFHVRIAENWKELVSVWPEVQKPPLEIGERFTV